MQTTNTLSQERYNRLEHLMQLPIQELASALARETNKFRSQHSADDLVGLSLFTLAITRQSEEAWSVLYQQYSPLVLTWVTQHPGAAPLLAQDGSGPLVNAAFAKFFVAVTPTKMEHFETLAALLKYLKMCVHSVVSDEARSRQAASQREELLELNEDYEQAEEQMNTGLPACAPYDLWQIIDKELHDEDERIVMSLTYGQQMKPREICRQHTRLFPTVEAVYRVKRNVFERLRRNTHLQTLYALS